jgi:thioredoxin-dependent peroxiredoxin
MTLEVGRDAPDFMLPDQNGDDMTLKDYSGKWLVLYFYPKDDTPGCTIEAIDFSTAKDEFAQHDALVVGVSPDAAEKHCTFITKHNLTIQLLCDTDHVVMEQYGAWGQKSFMGKKYIGVIRSTVLIDPNGKVAWHWPKVKAKGHMEEVKAKLIELQGR